MRVIAGKAKGRILSGPKGDRIRPVLDKVKGAIFNILGDVSGDSVLDLFAGTGAIGIEALSRGAERAVFVDFLDEAARIIFKNLERCQFLDRSSLLRLKIPAQLNRLARGARRSSPYNLIFVDPPYDKGLVNPTLRAIDREKILAPDGTVIVEHSSREPIADDTGLRIVDQRKYGQTLVSFLKG